MVEIDVQHMRVIDAEYQIVGAFSQRHRMPHLVCRPTVSERRDIHLLCPHTHIATRLQPPSAPYVPPRGARWGASRPRAIIRDAHGAARHCPESSCYCLKKQIRGLPPGDDTCRMMSRLSPATA